MSQMAYRFGCAVVLAMLTLAPAAHAQTSLISDGNFTGSFTNWTVTNIGCPYTGCEPIGQYNASLYGTAANGYSAALNANLAPAGFAVFGYNSFSNDGLLEQSFATVAGTYYQVTFQAGAFGDPHNGAQQFMTVGVLNSSNNFLYVTGLSLAPVIDFTGLFTTFTFTFQATDSLSTLGFLDTTSIAALQADSPTDTLISNVSVLDVPEPMSMALIGSGVLGLAAVRRRRRG
jgi:hypothetical protein